jgi:hypothetical protein
LPREKLFTGKGGKLIKFYEKEKKNVNKKTTAMAMNKEGKVPDVDFASLKVRCEQMNAN